MAYLFDTDAISESMRKRPIHAYIEWLNTIPRGLQFTSAINIGELYKGAFRSPAVKKWLARIDLHIIPSLTILPYDTSVARTYGRIRAELDSQGNSPGEADLQIAATALEHDLVVVTGNLKHYQRVPGLKVHSILADSRLSLFGATPRKEPHQPDELAEDPSG